MTNRSQFLKRVAAVLGAAGMAIAAGAVQAGDVRGPRDPYTDGAHDVRASREPYTDRANAMRAAPDPYVHAARDVQAPRDPYTEGA